MAKKCMISPWPPDSSIQKKIVRAASGVGLLGIGLAEIYSGATTLMTHLVTKSPIFFKEELWFGNSPPPSTEKTEYEKLFTQEPASNALLYLAASPDTDHNGALDPDAPFSLVSCLRNLKKEIRYETIRHPYQICQAIEKHSEKGPIEDLVISAHSNPKSMGLDHGSIFKVFDFLPSNCFERLADTAKIILFGCAAGGYNPKEINIAEWISWISGKPVIAALSSINTADCANDPSTGKLNVKLIRFFPNGIERDYTAHFNTSVYPDKKEFLLKMIAPAIAGFLTNWRMLRLGAKLLQGGGQLSDILVDKSSPRLKAFARRVGLDHQYTSDFLYTTAKYGARALQETGKFVDQRMDQILHPFTAWLPRSLSFLRN